MNCATVMLVLVGMNVKLLLLINIFIVQFAYAETVYKTRDAEGNIIFSDVQTEGAEVIELQEVQTLNIPKVNPDQFRETTKLTPKETEYSQFELISPENDSTIRSNEGNVSVSIEITPTLDEKHVIVFFMDGKEVSSGKSKQLSLTGLDRGSHIVTAAVINESENIIKSSNKVVFHLRKESKLFKNRANEDGASIDNSSVIPQPAVDNATAPLITSL